MTEFSRQDTFDKVATVITEQISVNKNEITETATLADLGADSIDLVKIIMALEERFNIAIDDAHAETLKNVGEVVTYVHQLRLHK